MTQNPLPARSNRHPLSGWISFLLFQMVVVSFCAMLVVFAGKMLPAAFPDTLEGREKALRVGVYISMPWAVAGLIAGIMAVMQIKHRRLLGVIGSLMNGAYVVLCLLILRGG